ncbi:MAG: PAS domain S-box protein [Symploca sp. SIO2E6]|nr:PAS domain S-box protein [Symploca sp. SIO2E6]
MSTLSHQLIVPSHIEYLLVNQDLLIFEASSGVQRFVDPPYEPLEGKQISDSFPELIGMEDFLIGILEGQQDNFDLKGIGRFTEDGSALYFDIYVTLRQQEANQDNCLVFFIEDVTERMVLEQKLVQASNENSLLADNLVVSQKYIYQIIQSMAAILLVTTPSGKITTVNQRALDLFKYRETELIGQSISILISDHNFLEQATQQHPLFNQLLNNIPVICYAKTGERLVIAFSCSAIQTELEELPSLIYVGRDITERQRTQRRLEAQYATTHILSESVTFSQAAPKLLQGICKSLQWDLGELWIPINGNQEGPASERLRCAETWVRPSVCIPDFIQDYWQTTFAPGMGLPGRIWITGSPQWFGDNFNTHQSLMLKSVHRGKWHTAIGFPIQSDGKILGVMTFFNREMQHLDEDLLQAMANIGSQIGQFIKRKQAEEALRHQQEQTERLLLNILPEPTARRLKQKPGTIAEDFAEVTVMFADIVGFTEIAASLSPIELVELLNQIFSAFDRLTEKHGLEKIKTVGDAYMVVSGIPTPQVDHAEAIAKMALDMLESIAQFNTNNNQNFSIRIGIHSGPVVAGVIGIKKFIYDLWGDTVNTASRMESHGIAGKIQLTPATYKRLPEQFLCEKRGTISVKGKGEMTTYFLLGRC